MATPSALLVLTLKRAPSGTTASMDELRITTPPASALIALATRGFPFAPVADAQVCTFRERGEALFHLWPRREVRRTVHDGRHDRPRLVLVPEQAVPVEALVLRRPRAMLGVRL